jgi:hypothetical protein
VVVAQFEWALKGARRQPCRKSHVFIAALQAAKNSVLHLILGGAAVHRCDNRTILDKPLAAEGRQFSTRATTPRVDLWPFFHVAIIITLRPNPL